MATATRHSPFTSRQECAVGLLGWMTDYVSTSAWPWRLGWCMLMIATHFVFQPARQRPNRQVARNLNGQQKETTAAVIYINRPKSSSLARSLATAPTLLSPDSPSLPFEKRRPSCEPEQDNSHLSRCASLRLAVQGSSTSESSTSFCHRRLNRRIRTASLEIGLPKEGEKKNLLQDVQILRPRVQLQACVFHVCAVLQPSKP